MDDEKLKEVLLADYKAKLKERKQDILRKYANRELTTFRQYDCHLNSKGDSVMSADREGDALTCGETEELMWGTSVRVFIKPEVKADDAVRALLKIALWVQREPFETEETEQTEEIALPF